MLKSLSAKTMMMMMLMVKLFCIPVVGRWYVWATNKSILRYNVYSSAPDDPSIMKLYKLRQQQTVVLGII